MKKLFALTALLICMQSYAQISKADFDALFSVFPPTAFEYVYLDNIRTYYTDGTNKLNEKKYFGNKMMIEAKENGVYLKFYEDATRSTLTDLMIIPYKKLDYIEAWKDGCLIAFEK